MFCTRNALLQIDLQHILYFIQVNQSGSFRRAALALDIRQSTISRRIRDLEERMGVLLLIRGHRGVDMTPAGHRFLTHAVEIMSRLNAAVCETKGIASRYEKGETPSASDILSDIYNLIGQNISIIGDNDH